MVRAPRAFDFEHAGTFASALAALARTVGVIVADNLENREAPVALALRETTLLAAFDEACRQAGCTGRQGLYGELAARAEREPPYPTAYVGPMRLRVVEMRSQRTTDFCTSTSSTQLRIRIDWEWPVNPASIAHLQIEGARVHEPTVIDRAIEILVEVPDASPGQIAGTVIADFDRPFDELRLPVPGSTEAHGIELSATPGSPRGCQISLAVRDGERARHGLEVSPVVLAIAADGDEEVPYLERLRSFASSGNAERWVLRPRDELGPIVETRLRVGAHPEKRRFVFALPRIKIDAGDPGDPDRR
jgi:hypothetical protein